MKRLSIITLAIIFSLGFASAAVNVSGNVLALYGNISQDNNTADVVNGFSAAANVGINAEVANGVSAYVELQDATVDGSIGAAGAIGIKDAYIDIKNIMDWGADLRAGRFDLPFGEEYLTATDNADGVRNPFILNSVDYGDFVNGTVTGVNTSVEGIQISGSAEQFNWLIGAANDVATDPNNSDEDLAIFAKIGSSAITDNLYVSASYYTDNRPGAVNGTAQAADLKEWRIDAKYDLDEGYIKGFYGTATTDNPTTADVDTDKYMIEGLYNVSEDAYLAARLSSVEPDNTKIEIQRLQISGGYWLADNTVVKLEWFQDDVDQNNMDVDGIILSANVAF